MSSSRKIQITTSELGRISPADHAGESDAHGAPDALSAAVSAVNWAPIIHESGESWQASDWRAALSEAFTDIGSLLEFLELDADRLPSTLAKETGFELRVPRGFAAQIRKGDPADPLLLQVLPSVQELLDAPGFSADPVGDLPAQAAPGILHKYHGRVLLIATGACAVHCRYCFRRHYPYAEGSASPRQWRAILQYLEADTSIQEVILSGGDPLLLSDARLAEWFYQLSRIEHLQRIRLHTRLPVVLPQRITPELVTLLHQCRLKPVLVLHVNHPNELAEPVIEAVTRLKQSGVPLLNQSVLLRAVNDSVEVLTELSERLFAAGVLPYYLHLLDRVQGAAHFEVAEATARALHQGLLAALPGYLVPRLVREIAGRVSKTPLAD